VLAVQVVPAVPAAAELLLRTPECVSVCRGDRPDAQRALVLREAIEQAL